MRAAQSHALLGPVLDVIIPDWRINGRYSQSEIVDMVRDQIRNPACHDPNDPSRCMPAGLVSGGNAADVAAFVSECAGRPVTGSCGPTAAERYTGEAAKGRQLFTELRCQGCHSTNGNVALAPTMKGLAGSQVELDDGTKVTANDAYLLGSILDPDAQVVKDFESGYMTTVIKPGQVSDEQAKAIVAYIKTIK
jgi:mono/diheme cytochrome c family protein